MAKDFPHHPSYAMEDPMENWPTSDPLPPLYADNEPPQETPPSRESRRSGGCLAYLAWMCGGVVLVAGFGGVGFIAASSLLKLPNAASCSAGISLRFSSASMRLYCAQWEADKQTLDSYLKAIRLVQNINADHPLRPEINRSIETWSWEILKLGEAKFQEGDRDQAIAMVQQIPDQTNAHHLVQERIARWQSIWSQGEAAFKGVQQAIRGGKWNEAFQIALKLTYLDNRYWASTQYDKALQQIQTARLENNQLDQVRDLVRRGGWDNLLQGIAMIQKIPKTSLVYDAGQNLTDKIKEKLIDIIDEHLRQEQWSQVIKRSGQLPKDLGFETYRSDWQEIAKAGQSADKGTLDGLEQALTQVQNISPDSPVYDLAQSLQKNFQDQIANLVTLDQARKLASPGDGASLNGAIAKAQEIGADNPLYNQAQRQIAQWRDQLATLEDRPLLDEAIQIANAGSTLALQEAIQRARQIQPSRPLYGEAQRKIRLWEDTVERRQDQPILDQATAMANAGNYNEAIALVRDLASGRILSGEVQRKMRIWQGEIDGDRAFQNAQQLAEQGTPQALAKAIAQAKTIPAGTRWASQGKTLIDRWAYDILALAQEESQNSITEAIRIAQLVPSGTAATSLARRQLDLWNEAVQRSSVNSGY